MNTLALNPESPETTEAASDQVLLRSWVQHGEGRNFAELVRRHLVLVRGIARRLVGEDLADDIAQTVFTILARKAPQLLDVRSLGAWLHQVTMLQCRNVARSRARERRNQQAAMEHAAVTQARDPLADALPQIDSAIESLPDKDRQLLFLRYSEGLSFAAAAERLGRSEAALRQQASRALEKVALVLRRRGVATPAAALSAGLANLLGGPATADAAARIASSATSGVSALSGATLCSITILTMSTFKCIIAGVGVAVALASVPIVWQWNQLAQASQETAKTGSSATVVTPLKSATGPAAPDVSKATKKGRAPAPNGNPVAQFEAMMEEEAHSAMQEWVRGGAWLEARRLALTLPLPADKEDAMRAFIESLWSERFLGDGSSAERRASEDGKMLAWMKENLSQDQFTRWQDSQRGRREALTEMLAEDALHGFSSSVALSDEQKKKLFEAAAVKVSAQFERNDYGGSMNIGAAVSSPSKPALEEIGQDLIAASLSPEQLEMWSQAREQERLIKEILPRRFSDRVLAVARKVGVDALIAGMMSASSPAPEGEPALGGGSGGADSNPTKNSKP